MILWFHISKQILNKIAICQSDTILYISFKVSTVINLNVGGCSYTTSLCCLTKFKDSMLATMFSGRHSIATDSNGHAFIDADGSRFRYILNFLRSGELPPINMATEVYTDADYFGLHELTSRLSRFPSIAKRISMEHLTDAIPCYEFILEDILDVMLKTKPVFRDDDGFSLSSRVTMSISTTARVPQRLASTEPHNCFYYGVNENRIHSDCVTDLLDVQMKEEQIISIILGDLSHRGYLVNLNPNQCFCRWQGAEHSTCSKKIFHINFKWNGKGWSHDTMIRLTSWESRGVNTGTNIMTLTPFIIT